MRATLKQSLALASIALATTGKPLEGDPEQEVEEIIELKPLPEYEDKFYAIKDNKPRQPWQRRKKGRG